MDGILRYLFILHILLLALIADEDLKTLLNKYALEADLSHQTKKEAEGYLLVFSRQDLDRMQIRSLNELIEQIPMMRYNESNNGLTSPLYRPYQPDETAWIQVYINDRALISPFTGSGLKLFGQMDIGYIDHAEVYFGIPSQTLGIEASALVIKLYTKDPARENTTLIGALTDTLKTGEVFGLSAKKVENFSYMAYLNFRNLKRSDVEYNNTPLSRDKRSVNFYGEIRTDHQRFELHALRAHFDNFMGQSINLDPLSTYTDIDYIYAGWYYQDDTKGLKAYINYAKDWTERFERSATIAGIYPTSTFPYYGVYQQLYLKMHESISDLYLAKLLKWKNITSRFGIQSRFKYFTFDRVLFDDLTIYFPNDYSRETILSIFNENTISIDPSRMLIASLKADRYIENGMIQDYSLFSGRLGYIYNKDHWVSKSFLFYGDFVPSIYKLYVNRYLYNNTNTIQKERVYSVSSKLTHRTTQADYSLLAAYSVIRDASYFDPQTTTIKNLEDDTIYETRSFCIVLVLL
ncbi:MAG: hypothetical protein DSY46_04275 [Hydrogenimonas sp.]|nr:MAG: hypothetical protein DSY46_04275 [Hydrogenimonas sp.]